MCSLFSELQAQDLPPLTDLKKGRYTDGSKTGRLRDFGEYFNLDPKSAQAFAEYQRKRKIHLRINYVALGALSYAFTRAATLGIKGEEDFDPYTDAILVAIGAFVLLPINWAFIEQNNFKLEEKLLESYPISLDNYRTKQNQIKLHLASSQNGLGLKVVF